MDPHRNAMRLVLIIVAQNSATVVQVQIIVNVLNALIIAKHLLQETVSIRFKCCVGSNSKWIQVAIMHIGYSRYENLKFEVHFWGLI